ncbi:DUF397 domain-containing protein [Streptomyces sp. NPDC001348]
MVNQPLHVVAVRDFTVHIRDSKATARPTLAFSARRWTAFVDFAARTAVE